MASINTYQLDSVIDPNDKVIGTDGTLGVDAGKTKNFTVSSLQTYINANAPIPGLQAVITSGNDYVSGLKRWQWNPTKFEHTDGDTGTGFAISGNEGFVLTNDAGFVTGRSSLGISQVQVGNGSLYKTTILGTNATLNRTINLPNSSGTFALLSDLPSSTPWNLESGTGINYVAGNVGIGTVSGTDALTVNGQILSTSIETGSILVEGNATIDQDLTAGTVTAATVTATTLSGNLVGTIDTTTTGTTQPSTTDNNLLATTAFVQDLLGDIVSGLQFQELWDANTDTPDLSGATPSNGDFWIVQVPGTTNLSGITSWAVGDWAIYIVPSGGGTAFWQKVDNTTGISGTGTGNQVTKWSGSGASTTLTDGIITDNGTNVGIGTTVPTAKLDVSGSVVIQNALTVDNDATFNSEVNVGTTNIIGGSISLTSNSLNKLHIVDTNVIEVLGDGGVNLKSSDGLTLSVSDLFEFKGSNGINIYNGASLTASLSVSQITANRTYQFPDDSGTLALFTDIPSGLINGAGTAGYITKWQDVDTLNDSVLFELSDKIGLGTITPTAQLETTEDILVNGITVGKGAHDVANTNSFGNTTVGLNALDNNTTGYQLTSVGNDALKVNTTGTANSAIGYRSLYSNTTGDQNIGIGSGALYSNTTGSSNIAIGNNSIKNSNGDKNVSVGEQALLWKVGGDGAVAIGWRSGYVTHEDPANNVTTVNNSVFVGNETKPLASSSTHEIIIGGLAKGLGNNTAVIGSELYTTKTRLHGNVGIGTDAPTAQIHTTENILVHDVMSVGIGSTIYTTTDASYVSARRSVAIGEEALDSNQYAFHNIAIGYKAMTDTLGAVGVNNTSGSYSIAIGSWALQNNTYGRYNSAIGYKSLEYNTGTEELGDGSFNTAMGTFSLNRNRLGQSNTGFGSSVLFSNQDGDQNTALGRSAGHYYFDTPNLGSLTNTNQGLFLGENSKALANNSVNEIVIGYDAVGLGSNTTAIGNSSITKTRIHGSVGIGTDAPASSLEVAAGDVEVSTVAKGFILKSPDGTRFRIAVANDGTLSASAV